MTVRREYSQRERESRAARDCVCATLNSAMPSLHTHISHCYNLYLFTPYTRASADPQAVRQAVRQAARHTNTWQRESVEELQCIASNNLFTHTHSPVLLQAHRQSGRQRDTLTHGRESVEQRLLSSAIRNWNRFPRKAVWFISCSVADTLSISQYCPINCHTVYYLWTPSITNALLCLPLAPFWLSSILVSHWMDGRFLWQYPCGRSIRNCFRSFRKISLCKQRQHCPFWFEIGEMWLLGNEMSRRAGLVSGGMMAPWSRDDGTME